MGFNVKDDRYSYDNFFVVLVVFGANSVVFVDIPKHR